VTPQRRRRAAVLVGAALAASLATVPEATSASAGGHDSEYTTNCPRPESLIRGTTWHSHKLATGVTLKEGRRSDSRGWVDMHVLTIDVLTPRLSFHPLVRKLAMRSKLSSLAHGHPKLVAATNTGYFDFRYGTPLGAVVDKSQPMLASSKTVTAIGFNANQHAQAGHLALTGTVTSGTSTRALAGINVLYPPDGITAYTARWGEAPINIRSRDALSRYVDKGVITSAAGDYNRAPGSGYLLVARGQSARNWLSSLKRGAHLAVHRSVKTDAAKPFTQAYSVGTQIVLPGGVRRTDLKCRRRYPMPARTAIGITNHGRRLIIAVIADRPGTAMHGLDSNQMSAVMADLGAKQAYLFDGSGSSELLARMPSHRSRLSLRNYPADGGPDAERPMPLGFGIFHG
jgi:hypothetical protein